MGAFVLVRRQGLFARCLASPDQQLTPRPICPADLPALAHLWHDGWHEAHAAHVPEALVNGRTLDQFRERVDHLGDSARVIGPAGAPLGFCNIDGDELDQLFVAPAGRGGGVASALLADGEARLAASGTRRAHLFCLPENTRAARFYLRQGWIDSGLQDMQPPAAGPVLRLQCIRFEKQLS